MKVRFRRGYEAVNTKNYKRFGTQYINFYLTDGILRKNKCARKFVPEDPLMPLIGYEENGKRWLDAIGIIELGEANYDIHSITNIQEIEFLRSEEVLPKKILLQVEDRILFAVSLGAVEPFEDIILFPRITETEETRDLDAHRFEFLYFNSFSGASALDELKWSINGQGGVSWSDSQGGSVRIGLEGPALFKFFKALEVEKTIIVDARIKLYASINGEADLRFGLWKDGSWIEYSKFSASAGLQTISVNNLVSGSFYVLLSGEIEEGSRVELDILELRVAKKNSPIIYFMPENMLD